MSEPRLGCELNAHRDLGFCAFCPGKDVYAEVNAWRLLAYQTKGLAPQPSCGDANYVRCPECQAHKSERHLEPCSLGKST